MHPGLLMLILLAAPDAGRSPRPVKKPPVRQHQQNPQLMLASLKAAQSDDPQARRAAFMNFSVAGKERKVPDAQPDEAEPRCVELASDGGCQAKVFVCAKSEEIDAEETHYFNSERFVGFGTTRATALAGVKENLMSRSRRSGLENLDTQCVVVFLDGCHQRAGLVCTTQAETVGSGTLPPPTTEIFDLKFQ